MTARSIHYHSARRAIDKQFTSLNGTQLESCLSAEFTGGGAWVISLVTVRAPSIGPGAHEPAMADVSAARLKHQKTLSTELPGETNLGAAAITGAGYRLTQSDVGHRAGG